MRKLKQAIKFWIDYILAKDGFDMDLRGSMAVDEIAKIAWDFGNAVRRRTIKEILPKLYHAKANIPLMLGDKPRAEMRKLIADLEKEVEKCQEK